MENEWTWVEGYDNSTYTDDSIFEIDPKTKQLQVITDQTLVSGENKSQFIRFQMDRFYDGIDLSKKNIQIIYMTESGYSDINAAKCVEKSENQLRFGWVVPPEACYDVGTLSFGVEFVGDEYTLKTRACDIEVYDGLNGGEVIPEPTEKVWYIELQQRCDYILTKAEDAKNAAENSAVEADKSQAAALESEAKAKASETEAAASEAAAAGSAAEANDYMNLAANVFKIAGTASLAINEDDSVSLILTKEE